MPGVVTPCAKRTRAQGLGQGNPHARGPSDDGPQTRPAGNARTTDSRGRTPHLHAPLAQVGSKRCTHCVHHSKPTQFDGTYRGEKHDHRKLWRAPPPNNRVRRHLL
ncbi:MAG: hypothetical protein GY820_09170 [Gammaproteobacteria bacterium]|nr:hypothetical protein [Gammaproteobacteria bacterium]